MGVKLEAWFWFGNNACFTWRESIGSRTVEAVTIIDPNGVK